MATRTPLATAVGRRRLPPLWVVRGVMAMRAALRRWADALVPTDVLLMEHAGVFGKPILLRLVTEMQIPDILAERGPMTAAEIARLADVQPDMLHRALRFLCTFDVFKLDGQGRFSNTRLSSELTKGAVMRNAVLLLGGELNFQLWDNLEDTVRTGADAFSRRRGSPWEWFTAHPDDGERFVHGMASLTAMEAAFIAGSYPYGQFRVVCDVGGGSGVLLASILARCPDTRAILVDRASVLSHSRSYLADAGVLGRVELVEGDFFEKVPPGADAYMLKDVLHDWDDERCARILGVIRAAAAPGTRLLVHETLTEPDTTGWPAIVDFQMAVTTGGRNRSLGELRALLARSGFQLRRTIRLPSPTSTLEALVA